MKSKTTKLPTAKKLVDIHLYGKSLEIFSEPHQEQAGMIRVWALLNNHPKGEHTVLNDERASAWAREYLNNHLERLMCGWKDGLGS